MKTAAIIAEYNPFHQGHAWQIGAIRQSLGEETAIVAAMSGCFTQRGEPAVLDKWTRTRAALACGADLVLELPAAYATASAERFASGGVRLIQATGLDCHLVFGSECGRLDPLQTLADLLADEPAGYRGLLRQSLDQGESFPAARQAAVAAWTGDPELAGLLGFSNNILAVEYLKAIRSLPDCRLTPLTFRRQGQAYLDSGPTVSDAGFASASAIRRRVFEHTRDAGRSGQTTPDAAGLFTALLPSMPSVSLAILMEAVQRGSGPVFWEDLASLVISMLRSRPVEEIEQVPGMSEGLARRLAAAAARPGEASDGAAVETDRFARLMGDAATKRFPQTRIQRALLSLLLGLRAEDLEMFDEAGGPQYIRVLGFGRKGRHLLKIMRRLAQRPVLMKGSDILEYKEPAFRRMAELDVLSTDLWMTAAGASCGRDFDTPVVMG